MYRGNRFTLQGLFQGQGIFYLRTRLFYQDRLNRTLYNSNRSSLNLKGPHMLPLVALDPTVVTGIGLCLGDGNFYHTAASCWLGQWASLTARTARFGSAPGAPAANNAGHRSSISRDGSGGNSSGK